MKLKEIHRTSTFAWSPSASLPLLATGTVAGALDESFSNESQLEIWAPNFLDKDEYDLGGEGQHGPRGSVRDTARYACIVPPGSLLKLFFLPDSIVWLGVMSITAVRAVLLQRVWRTESSLCGIPQRYWPAPSKSIFICPHRPCLSQRVQIQPRGIAHPSKHNSHRSCAWTRF